MTALVVTPSPATGSCILTITGAPIVTPAYVQGTGIDGWTTAAPGTLAAGGAPGTYSGAEGFQLTKASATSTPAVASKTITGLTIGQKYVLTAKAKKTSAGIYSNRLAMLVSGIGGTPYSTLSDTIWSAFSYTFTATATSHTLQASLAGYLTQSASAYVDDVKLVPYSVNPATTIRRTDANGVRTVRRKDGQEPVSGAMTFADYEAALTGSIQYDVIDTLGVTVSATTNLNAVTVPWLTVVTRAGFNVLSNPSAETDVSNWSKTTGNALTRDTASVPAQDGAAVFKWTTSAVGDWAYTGDYAVVPGQTWASGVYVQGTGSVTVRVTWRDAAGTAITGAESAALTLTGGWQWLTVTGQAPANAAYAFLRLVQKTAGAQTVYFDAASLTEVVGRLDSITDYRASRAFLGSVHYPVDRKFPLVVTGPLASREGSFKAWCPTYAAALAVATVADAGEALMLRQPTFPGLDMYLAATAADVTPGASSSAGRRWQTDLSYVELDVPADPLKAA